MKLTYIPILRYRRAADAVAVEICAFVLQIFFVRGMQVILFYNVVYVYLCKIGEEKFGGWWRSFSWLVQSNPVVWHPHCVCDCPNESTGLLFQFLSIQRITKRQLTDTVFHCTVATSVRMRNSVAYCCCDFVVNRRKALLANRLAVCYDS